MILMKWLKFLKLIEMFVSSLTSFFWTIFSGLSLVCSLLGVSNGIRKEKCRL